MAEKKEWTVMIFMASDNPLAPGVVSQLKAIKQAGYQPQVNVVAQFDPQTPGTPTHIFDVNLVNKLKKPGESNIGFAGDDPFVRNLLEDKLWRDQTNRHGKILREELKEILAANERDSIEYDPPVPPDGETADAAEASGRRGDRPRRSKELPPKQSLENFLKFCREEYPANHYILFILGHGVVVGNDIFLFDEHIDEHTDAHSLTLVGLGEVLSNFACQVRDEDSEFELIGFHSCSVSSLEVAYELRGTAKYMLASQGPAFVGSWPYRQILIRLFKDVELKKLGSEEEVERMLTKIFFYCLHNSTDFLLAGYSYDLCMCDLGKVKEIKPALQELSGALMEGLKSCLIRNLILLAHWRSQSYWEESYTDLSDFCFCLNRLCEEYYCLHNLGEEMQQLLRRTTAACQGVMDQLKKERNAEKIIALAEFAGPAYQYSHGLSIYFPWSRPSADKQILTEYAGYKIEETGWREFLEAYLRTTMRKTRREEMAEAKRLRDAADPCEIYRDACEPETEADEQIQQPEDIEVRSKELLEDVASLVYNEEGQLGASFALRKPDPSDPAGDSDCTCPSIKNYPHDTRPTVQKGRAAGKKRQVVPLSGAFSSLVPEGEP